ncbi:MAG: exodeoxyribonuclease VII small subunit [Oscillospiraceae bacterium]|jgi:exodeoxyribonuclease VII small subunit|nr:exodeoxyribonuclease VII small subunit [Oscillospiraceae bacterium]
MPNISFEESIKKLEDIALKLQNPDINLQESIKLYEEGSKLAVKCYSILKKAEQKIKTIEISKEEI